MCECWHMRSGAHSTEISFWRPLSWSWHIHLHWKAATSGCPVLMVRLWSSLMHLRIIIILSQSPFQSPMKTFRKYDPLHPPKFQDLLSQLHNPSSPPRSTSSNESSSCSLAHCLQILQHACMCIMNSQPEAQSCYVSCADFQHPRSNACSNGLNPCKAQLPQRSWRLLSEGSSCCCTAALHENILLQG